MTKIEKLLLSPGVGRQVVRGIIATSPGTTKSIPITNGTRNCVVKATVLRKVGTKLVK